MPGSAMLLALIHQAAVRPKARGPTRPTSASKIRGLDGKIRRSGLKDLRARPGDED